MKPHHATDIPHRHALARATTALLLAAAPFAALSQSTPAQGRPAQGIPAQHTATTLDAIQVMENTPSRLQTQINAGSNLGLSVLQTPASISVISRQQLDARGDANLSDAITRGGGISAMGHPGNGMSALSTRGFSDSASVMRLYDGLRQYGGVGITFPFDTWSVERIEVLRGPASVIHGDGAIGGVVNIVPRKPTRGAIQNEVQASIGSQDTARLAAGSGGALSTDWSYRVDASGNYSSGWVDRGRHHDLSVSAALQWDPDPDLQLRLSHARSNQHPMRYFGTPLVNGRQLDALGRKNYNVADSVIRFRDSWSQLDAVWTPNDNATLRARLYQVDSHRDWRNAERYLFNAGTGLIDRSDNTAISHEQAQTGLTSTLHLDHAWGSVENTFSVGVDTSRSRFKHINNTYAGSSGPVDPYQPVPGNFQSDIPTIPRYRNDADQVAVFAEDRLALNARWSLLAGLRYDHANVKRADLVSGTRAFSKDYSNVGWRVGSVVELQPDMTLYAQYAEAADPVGGLLMISAANAAFDLSQGRQLEVGMKQRLAGGRGEWTLAAYQIRKTDLLTRDVLNPALRVQVGEQTSRGIEASLSLALAEHWLLDANATALRATFEDFSESVGSPAQAVSRAGNVPPNVAERLANVWLSWNFLPDWTVASGLRYVGKRYANNANTLVLPSHTTTDLSLSWQARPATRLSARAYNLFDKRYYTTAYYTDTQWFVGADRRVELTLNHRF